MSEKKTDPFAGIGNLNKSAQQGYEFEEGTERLRDNKKHIIAAQLLYAELRFHKFEALIKAGFSEAQALELCKDMSIL